MPSGRAERSEPGASAAPPPDGAHQEQGEWLRRRILADGPITVADFMAEALLHPRHGYYSRGAGIGADGDFVTAPEISQMFGELLGLWCIDTWRRLGAPAPFALVELGPGRGTLMADMLRIADLDAAFSAALRPVLVEASPALRHLQAERIGDPAAQWIADLSALPDLPVLVIANEFFDALPIRQFLRLEDGWHERLVGLDPTGAFRFQTASTVLGLPACWRERAEAAPPGTVLELRPAADALAAELAGRIARRGGAALAIDYGSAETPLRDSLQAVRGHARHPVLLAPGSADITAHVDFTALARAARQAGCATAGPVTQGVLLERLGLGLRTERLAAAAPAQADAIRAAAGRLAGPTEMGSLFKALAILPRGLPECAGFDRVEG